MSLNVLKMPKIFLQEIEQFQDDQAIPKPGVVVRCVQSKTFPPRVFHRHILRSFAWRFLKAFFVVVLMKGGQSKLGRLEKTRIKKILLESPWKNSKPPCCDVRVLFCAFPRVEMLRTERKTLGARTRTNNKLNHIWHRAGNEPGPHWWEASALTSTLSLRTKNCRLS